MIGSLLQLYMAKIACNGELPLGKSVIMCCGVCYGHVHVDVLVHVYYLYSHFANQRASWYHIIYIPVSDIKDNFVHFNDVITMVG